METLREARQLGRALLKQANPDLDEILDCDVLIEEILGYSRTDVITKGEQKLAANKQQKFQQALKRRQQREPVAYITGFKEFYGYRLHVSPEVLIPRPETELLVEQVIEDFGKTPKKALFLDIGTGSGAIIISLVKELSSLRPDLHFIGADISPTALEITKQNLIEHKLSSEVELIQGNLLTGIPKDILDKYEHIFLTANLPYIANGEQLPPEVYSYEPHTALFGGETGCELIEMLLEQTTNLSLTTSTSIYLEHGCEQREHLRAICAQFPSYTVETKKDLSGMERIVTLKNYPPK